MALPAQAPASEGGAAPSAQESISLEPGKPIEREISGGQSHSYKITVNSGQYLHIVVEQRGIDVALALFTPDDKKIGEVDSEKATVGSETISAIAEAGGPYKVEARSAEKTAKTGHYEIKVEELREATAEDKYRVAAEAAFREAEQLQEGTLVAKRKSIEKYHEALELYRRATDRNGEAQTLNNIGEVYQSLGETRKALEKFNEALPLSRAIGDWRREGTALSNIGLIYWSVGEMQKALEKFNEALPLRRAAGDRRGEGATLNNIGLVYSSLGEKQKALEKYNEALPIRQAVGDRRGEAQTLNNIGEVYRSLGEMQKVLDKHNEALPIRRAVGDRRGEAQTLNNIGMVYWSVGEMQKALEKFNESLPLNRMVGDRRGEAQTLNNIGMVYWSLGERQKALEKYNEALPIFQAVGDRRGEAVTLLGSGAAYQSLGEIQKALEKYNEALPISRAIGYRSGEAVTLLGFGEIYKSLGETRKALEKYNEALPRMREVGYRNGEAVALLRIAQIEQKRGNLTQARQVIEQAVSLVESLRTNITSQELRASYFASRHEFFESYIDVLMQMHKQNPAAAFDAVALAVSERARARSLLELLEESRVDIRQGVDSSLLEHERSLQERFNARAAAQVLLLNRKHTPEQADAAAKEIAAITAEYEEIQAQIRARSPRYAALTQPQPLSLAEIQQQVLDPDTLLLEYSLGDNASYLFVVSQTSITWRQLPKRAEIEAATRRVRDLLTAPQPQPGDIKTKYRPRVKEAREGYWQQAAELSQMLLGPAASQLGGRRLLIVADGSLQYLPFGALPAPETERQSDGETKRHGDKGTGRQEDKWRGKIRNPQSTIPIPLIVDNEIVHLPSASALAELRRDMAGREPTAKAVAVLADPVFSADDARVKQGDKTQVGKEAPSDLTRAVNDVRGELRRLLMTRDEAEAILSVMPRNGGLAALDFRANRAVATGDELGNYRVVHFATHGLLDSEHPELSGLVLSLVDEQGRPQEGFLRLHDIFNLRLRAELVVLSACQTGLGKEVKGEGLVGLTRGFMYAGAARVVASLWRVDDAATAELMKRFYRLMLKDAMRPAAALRAAQIEMWKRPQWQSPFYWGGFTLQGEWK
jgi:CHAT domain-containing protein/predicted negative regulator of RcsB-dependent stress response